MTTDENTPPPLPAALKDSTGFDFLIGDWDVQGVSYAPDGVVALRYAGRWQAEHRNAGSMVVDEFTSWLPDRTPLAHFITLRTYCDARARWEMTFLMSGGSGQAFFGNAAGQEMHLHARGQDLEGNEGAVRIRFHGIHASGFSWEQQSSYDGGKTWRCAVQLTATRRRSALSAT